MFRLFIADLKMLVRNRQALFWTLMFPLMFTFIFGFFFGKNQVAGTIDIINKSDSELATGLVKTVKDTGLFKIESETRSEEDAKKLVDNNKIAAILIVPENFGKPISGAPLDVRIIEDPGSSQTTSVLKSLVGGYLTEATFRVNQIKGPRFGIVAEKTSNRTLTYFDFVLAGVLGLALMNSSIIGISVSMSKYREDKILKRITTTPIKTWWFILDEVLSHLILNFIQVSLILIIGIKFFDAHIYGSFFLIYLLALIGAILFQLLGFVVAGLAKTTDAAQGMATAITIPMMFLGGVFFPIDSLPKWLYSIVQYLPIAPLLRLIRGTTLEAKSPLDNPTNLIIVFVWIIVALVFSSYKFKLSEE